eukprot:Gregarina_sp_Poly_1__6219@NODE_329_length_9477_cov_82_111477_g279_i0_p1_GENE_NODE_329_length_9477_cov_82_111477_g279_i0NODE_329_length_9477_cov_82_111477_g279_i0_p1_ORF_typecomplete_len1682_score254_39RNA_pol_Rpb1_5/PF04998_17/2_6e123RNA_pol_Rpb1_2/PF00623_20/2_2e69RNA_pol_Rpb1_1/PF04997_12/5_9e68RNA_pol_Rpb1_3/PF04983_18/7_5e03RNA_pol_Rpb1_3/PF04983_18/3_2e29RNA_pol_Rpb1_4/PF05000_17/1e24Ribosomal_S14/PF00253_21/9_5e03Ribosomal_S14/PF00253_21/0_48_NODE_329_length_9477_cov_82_111477_g279_i036018
MKQFVLKERVDEKVINNKITGLTFDALSSAEIVKYSNVRVTHPSMYMVGQATRPAPFGVLDLHLGANRADRNKEVGRCQTCGGGWDECVGHWGYVKLPVPVFHAGYFKHLISILYCVCKACGKLLLSEEEAGRFLRRMRRNKNDAIVRKRIFKSLVNTAKKINRCAECDQPQGMIRKINQGTPDKFMKIQHEIKTVSETDGKITKIIDDLDPSTVHQLMSKISASDLEVMDITRPEKFLIENFPVPPSSIRPTINLGDAGVNEDDLSSALRDIIFSARQFQDDEVNGAPTHMMANQLEALQIHTAKFINTDFPQLEAAAGALDRGGSNKLGRGVAQRLKGKEGRFRCNLSGKRVDFSGRTVISPDPNCPIPCVVVPMWSARRLTFPERVCTFNIDKLRQCVLNGPDEWPGALSVVRKADGFKASLKFVNRRQAAGNLQLGDIVERHLWNDDVVLFNRQPSLHRMSIMAHKARVMPWRTLRFNECVCSPYNADFDGDEMNCHLPQTQEARTEALLLMGVVPNLTTPKNGEPLIAATQDFLSGSWMICHKDVFLTRDKLALYCCYFSDGLLQIDLPPPAIVKPMELWTGKQLYNILIRPNRSAKVMLNFELKERDFKKPLAGEPPFMCPKDGYILFYQSELMCGALGKKVLGGGSKEGLFFHLIRDNNPQIAAEVMGRVAKLTGRWFANRGMTIGIDDVTPDDTVTRLKGYLLEKGYNEVQQLVTAHKEGKMNPDPGCNLAQTLENRSKGVLDDLRTKAGEMAVDNLHPLNKPLIMFLSGAKGALINMAQMIALVGQQNVNGKRIWDGFVRRTLPHYGPSQRRAPKAKGFVANSFYTGLTPDEFFFHTMSGREGLVDTAVKTADTGYMQRRLVKALEDLSVKYDRTVRTSDEQVVQFVYGDDGLNPQLMELKTALVDLEATFKHVRSLTRPSFRAVKLAPKACHYLKRKRASGSKFGAPMKKTRTDDGPRPTLTEDTSATSEADVGLKISTHDPDVVLPPANDSAMIRTLLKYLETDSGDLDETFPKSLRQKIDFLHCYMTKKYPSMPPKESAKAELGQSELPEGMDPLVAQVRRQLIAHGSCWEFLSLPKQNAPLLPFEFLQWVEFLLPRMKELQPTNVKAGEIAARNEAPTHQPQTGKIRNFEESVVDWCQNKAAKMAKVREQNGEPPALKLEDYHAALLCYRGDVESNRLARPYDTIDPRTEILNELDRRVWFAPGAADIVGLEERLQRKRRLDNAEVTGVSLLDSSETETESDTGLLQRQRRANASRPRWRISSSEWITVPQLLDFCRLLWRKYNKALIEPGEAVGAIGAQSIGEPGTQMTLKTFHFAGVASMNVTLGVPRIKEIINAASKIMTPILIVPLSINQHSFSFAQMVKGKIEKVVLGQVCKYIKQVLSPEGTWIVLRLDSDCISSSFLEIDAFTVKDSILEAGTVGKLKIRDNLLDPVNKWKLIVKPPGGRDLGLSFQVTALMDALLTVRVCGLETIRRSVIQKKELSNGGLEYSLAVEGEGLRQIMSIEGVCGTRVGCNNIMEVKETLGIEAARQTIISEIKGCMDAYSMDIDIRHMQLLGDVMTYRGEVLGITRHGIQKMRASVLCLASFEETNEHLYEAAVHKKSEHVQGVSEAIILGKRVALGTGAFEVLQAPAGFDRESRLLKTKERSLFMLSKFKKQLVNPSLEST